MLALLLLGASVSPDTSSSSSSSVYVYFAACIPLWKGIGIAYAEFFGCRETLEQLQLRMRSVSEHLTCTCLYSVYILNYINARGCFSVIEALEGVAELSIRGIYRQWLYVDPSQFVDISNVHFARSASRLPT